MMNQENSLDGIADEQADQLLTQLMHLKQYERPDSARMTRNKQNIMRQVREANASKRKTIGELLEISIPWFFSEPKYGIAALFVAFVGLQYAGISAKNSTASTGIYTSTASVASLEQDAALSIVSNRYPNLPGNYKLFSQPEGDQSVLPANFELKR